MDLTSTSVDIDLGIDLKPKGMFPLPKWAKKAIHQMIGQELSLTETLGLAGTTPLVANEHYSDHFPPLKNFQEETFLRRLTMQIAYDEAVRMGYVESPDSPYGNKTFLF